MELGKLVLRQCRRELGLCERKCIYYYGGETLFAISLNNLTLHSITIASRCCVIHFNHLVIFLRPLDPALFSAGSSRFRLSTQLGYTVAPTAISIAPSICHLILALHYSRRSCIGNSALSISSAEVSVVRKHPVIIFMTAAELMII
jgi:hypothetical protein